MPNRNQLLDAWERDFPLAGRPVEEVVRQRGAWTAMNEADSGAISQPLPPTTIGLTRGGEASRRIDLARQELRRVDREGGDGGSALREYNAATDELNEAFRAGTVNEPLELAGRSTSIYGPYVASPWRPTY